MPFTKILVLAPLVFPVLWAGASFYYAAGIPRVEILAVDPLAPEMARSVPFFELMSPVPEGPGRIVPRLEYRKGPPDRFLERISLVLQDAPGSPKERVVHYGRRTRNDLWGLSLFPEESAREARYLEAAIRVSQGQEPAALSAWRRLLLRPFLLREASLWLGENAIRVLLMEQAGSPAFLIQSTEENSGRARATALFLRRNAFYRVDFQGDKGFSRLNPESYFRMSFLTEKRGDAVAYLAGSLSEIHLETESARQNLSALSWPLLLLAANLSVDPASLDSFLHFAGLNALLFRSESDREDLEITDIFRNNVLSSDRYAQDLAPETPKAREISRLARLLTRNFEL